MSKIVLISGIAGFLGSNICLDVLEKQYLVKGIVRKSTDLLHLKTRLSSCYGEEYSNAFIKNDIFVYEKIEDIYKIADIVKPDILINLAGCFIPTHNRDNIYLMIESNISFATILTDACVENGCRKVVTFTSYWEHYDKKSYNPVDLYAATKKAYEDILYFYSARLSVSALILTIFDTFGAGDWRNKILNIVRDLEEDSEIDLSSGRQMMHLVYVDDVCNAVSRAIEILQNSPNGIFGKYAILSKEEKSLHDILETFVMLAGKKVKLNWGKRAERSNEIVDVRGIGIPIPGVIPPMSLEEGLLKYIKGI